MKRHGSFGMVSIIIPTYNHGQYVVEAIRSALSQTYTSIEVIVVDNFSTDGTKEIVRPLLQDGRLKYFQFDNKGIIAAARNFGVTKASGEYVAFLDSDDIWFPEKLAKQLPFLDNPDIAIVASNFKDIGQTQYTFNHLNRLVKQHAAYAIIDFRSLTFQNDVITSSALIRKESFVKAGGFDESKKFAFIEDWELWLRVLHAFGDACIISEPLLYYRVAGQKRDMRKISLNNFEIARKLLSLGYIDSKWCKKMIQNRYADVAIAHLAMRDKLAAKYYWLAFRHGKSSALRLKSLVGLLLAILPDSMAIKMREVLYFCRSWI